MKEFAQKNGLVFFWVSIILAGILIVTSCNRHDRPRMRNDFPNAGDRQGMMQQNGVWQKRGLPTQQGDNATAPQTQTTPAADTTVQAQ